jgi:glycosyltransferase involved in cell wall biosynthesis
MSDARRIRVAIVSHAYTASENRKNIAALVQHADVRVVMPRDMPQTVLTGWVDEQGRRHETEGGGPATVDSGLAGDAATPYRPHPRIQLFGAQYLLRSWSFGLREFEPDVIHVDYDPWATIFLQTLHARRVSAPKARLVITSRKNTYRRYPGALGRAKHELAMFGVRRLDHVHAESELVAQLYVDQFGFPRDRISVWPQLGLDMDVFHPAATPRGSSEGPLALGFVGRFDDDKGILDLVEAVERVRERTGRDVELHCLGHGVHHARLAKKAEADAWLVLHPRVPHHEVPAFLAGLDLYAMPSRIMPDHEEHDAHALIEAMGFGLACVGSRCGAIPEVLEQGAGLVCEENDPASLADALEQLVTSPELRKQLSQRAHARAREVYSIDAVTKRRLALYERLLGQQ